MEDERDWRARLLDLVLATIGVVILLAWVLVVTGIVK